VTIPVWGNQLFIAETGNVPAIFLRDLCATFAIFALKGFKALNRKGR
jgi:hypothetical protein